MGNGMPAEGCLSKEELEHYFRREQERIETEFRTRPVTGWVPSLIIVSDTLQEGRRCLTMLAIPNPPHDVQGFMEVLGERIAREGRRAGAALFSATAWGVRRDAGGTEPHPAEHPLRQETLVLSASTPAGDAMMVNWPILRRKGDRMLLGDPLVGNSWDGTPMADAPILSAFWRGYSRGVRPR